MPRASRTKFFGAAFLAASLNPDGNAYALECVRVAQDPHGFQETGMCMKAQRLINKAINKRFDAILHLGSARKVYNALKNSEYAVKDGTSQQGDLLFYMGVRHGIHGHVTRRVYGNLEYEVSSAYGGKNTDCRSFQPLGFLGPPSLTVRFPVK